LEMNLNLGLDSLVHSLCFMKDYVRLNRCLSALFIPVFAFVICSGAGYAGFFIVSAVVVLIIAGTYSYNSLRDWEEDENNPLHENPLDRKAINNWVNRTPILLFLTAAMLSILVNSTFFVLISSLVLFSYTYSRLKVKSIFIVKTLTIPFCYALLFISCYTAFSGGLTVEVMLSAMLLFLLFFSYSVISDIRDIKPDRENKHETIPVRIGYNKSMKLVLLLFLLINILNTVFLETHLLAVKSATVVYMFIPVQLYLIHELAKKRLYDIDSARGVNFILITALMVVFFL